MLFRVLRLWAFGDRIRASPREGKLLRLDVGTCIRIGGKPYEITRRDQSPDRQTVTYRGHGSDDELELTVFARIPPDAGPPRVLMSRKRIGTDSGSPPPGHDAANELSADDIEIFG